MGKVCTITIRLVPEAKDKTNEEIEKEILEESSIPWCKEIEKVSIKEVENPYKELIGHGFNSLSALVEVALDRFLKTEVRFKT